MVPRQTPLQPAIATALLLLGACTGPGPDSIQPAKPAAFAGSETCANCHDNEFRQWQGSQHQQAMQRPTAASVAGDFSGTAFDYFGTATEFRTEGDKYVVRTDNGRNEVTDYEVRYTFGVDPLQQYLVDGERGRLQALSIAWDNRPAAAGGQRWYHLYPDEKVAPGDSLHWTGPQFTWNTMCAECHSTGVQSGYDVDSDTFDTRYSEISVGCEACHGPGSRHLEQAAAGHFDTDHGLALDLDDREGAAWLMNPATGIAELSRRGRQQQVESCGRCHARRAVLTEEYEYGQNLLQTHLPALLEDGLYYPDGRILDEVYVYGSFLQSRMYAAGVTCSDCHNPHSANLRTGPDPNAVCLTCHLPAKFATSAHNPATVGDCTGCHMPTRTYMGVDPRRDHGFRIPGAGDAPGHYGQVIAAGRAGGANDRLLAALENPDSPAIARATMLSLLRGPLSPAGLARVESNLADPDPLLRVGALRGLRAVPAADRGAAGSFLLRDPVRGVRVEAALTFLDMVDLLPLDDARAFGPAIEEYRHALRLSAALPQSALQLAELESRLGNADLADQYYQHALHSDARFAPAQHAYGLFLVRRQRQSEALPHLQQAAALEPDNARYTYVYAIALNSLGQPAQALPIMRDAWLRFPDDVDIGFALATMLRDAGLAEEARQVAAQLGQRFPGDARMQQLIPSLR